MTYTIGTNVTVDNDLAEYDLPPGCYVSCYVADYDQHDDTYRCIVMGRSREGAGNGEWDWVGVKDITPAAVLLERAFIVMDENGRPIVCCTDGLRALQMCDNEENWSVININISRLRVIPDSKGDI